MRYYLDFEKKLEPVERRIAEIQRFHDVDDPRFSKELLYLSRKVSKLEKEIYGELSNWQRSQISRHLNRPHALDYIQKLFSDFSELHGDRKFKDDSAMVCGFAKFEGMKGSCYRSAERSRRSGNGNQKPRNVPPGRL